MDTRDLHDKGLKLRREMFGRDAVEQRMNAFGAFGEPLQNMINAYAYGDVWSRSALPQVVLTHGHPDHLWGVLDANDNPIYPNASYIISAVEWDVWSDPDVMQKLPAAMPKEQIAKGAKNHLTRINNKIVTVREGYEIISGVRVIDTPGHTPGHISLEAVGGDGLVIAGDALTHILISFQHPSWKVPVDHEGDRGISTRLRLLDQLATDKRRLVAAHLPFPGTGFVERKDRAYQFVAG